MLGFFRFGSMIATLASGLALLGAFGGCGPATGTCAADNHTVLDATGKVIDTCTADQACSNGGCTKCDPTLCLPKNQCIKGWQTYDEVVKGDTTTQTTECRLTCSKQTDCPFNYHCMPGGPATGYCVQDRTSYPPTVKGEAAAAAPWGVACDPTKGIGSNSDCDSADNFWCYGISPTDANAYCTQEQCNDDGDCPGGWWCATINDTPNVQTARRTDFAPPGQAEATYKASVAAQNPSVLTTVCMPRVYNLKPGTYCAPCKTDLDCPLNESTPQHCVSADANGGAELVCAVECTDSATQQPSDKLCPEDYACQDPGSGTPVCVPRAKTCIVQKGTTAAMCSPCHSDADCDPASGFCVIADYSTEHYCTTLSGVTCAVNGTTLTDQCPATSGTPSNAGVSCTYSGTSPFPKNQCFGLVTFGTGSNAAQVGGCWTKH